jgi:hypothetical protein
MAIVRLEGLGKLKKFTSLGLDPATFWLVALCLNQLCMQLRAPETLLGYTELASDCRGFPVSI